MSTLNSSIPTNLQSLLETISNITGVSIDFSESKSWRLELSSADGQTLNVLGTPLDQGVTFRELGILPGNLTISSSGGLNADVSFGTATLVASTVTVTVPTPPDGETAVPSGSTVYATVTTPGGKVKQLSAVRTSDTQITISSPGVGYGVLLESAGVTGTLVAGTLDLNLANAVGDRLSVALVTSHGTAGVLSVKRKSGTQVTVQSWLAGTGIQALDISDIIVYNFGQSTDETSTVRWLVNRP